jgi:hypothetical protein
MTIRSVIVEFWVLGKQRTGWDFSLPTLQLLPSSTTRHLQYSTLQCKWTPAKKEPTWHSSIYDRENDRRFSFPKFARQCSEIPAYRTRNDTHKKWREGGMKWRWETEIWGRKERKELNCCMTFTRQTAATVTVKCADTRHASHHRIV